MTQPARVESEFDNEHHILILIPGQKQPKQRPQYSKSWADIAHLGSPTLRPTSEPMP